MIRGIAASLAAALLLAASPAWAGAWVRSQWGFYLRLDTKYYTANEIFDGDGHRIAGDWWDDDSEFHELSSTLIAELGLLDQLTVTLQGSARMMYSFYGQDGGVTVAGFSDVIVGLRYGPYQRRIVTAIEATVEIPTGYPRDEDRVRLGPGYVNGQLRALVGGGIPMGVGNYFDVGFGYRLRGGPSSDDLVASAAFGIEPYERLWLRVGFSGTFNLGDSSETSSNIDATYVSVGGAVTYLFETGFGIELAASGDVWGKNTFAGWGISVVLQYER